MTGKSTITRGKCFMFTVFSHFCLFVCNRGDTLHISITVNMLRHIIINVVHNSSLRVFILCRHSTLRPGQNCIASLCIFTATYHTILILSFLVQILFVCLQKRQNNCVTMGSRQVTLSRKRRKQGQSHVWQLTGILMERKQNKMRWVEFKPAIS